MENKESQQQPLSFNLDEAPEQTNISQLESKNVDLQPNYNQNFHLLDEAVVSQIQSNDTTQNYDPFERVQLVKGIDN